MTVASPAHRVVARSGSARPAPAEQERRDRGDAGRRAHLRVAEHTASRRRRIRLAIGVGTIVAVVSLFALVAFSVFVVQGQFRLDELERQRQEEQLRYERLRLETARLSSPETIVSSAIALGMVEPDDVSFIDAPAAAPTGDDEDLTSSTLSAWDEVKPSLVADP
jgi:hypothetical protein